MTRYRTRALREGARHERVIIADALYDMLRFGNDATYHEAIYEVLAFIAKRALEADTEILEDKEDVT